MNASLELGADVQSTIRERTRATVVSNAVSGRLWAETTFQKRLLNTHATWLEPESSGVACLIHPARDLLSLFRGPTHWPGAIRTVVFV